MSQTITAPRPLRNVPIPPGASPLKAEQRRGTVSDMRTAIVYCRISEDREDNHGGVDNQEKMCLELAADLGWQVVRVYVDNDVSAASGKHRKWYAQLLEDLRNGEANAVIAAHPDRLHRRPVELEEFINLTETRDVVVRTKHAGHIDLATSSGRMVARMLGAAARAEVDRMIERGRDHKDKMASEGKWRGGPRPFGYQADGVTINEDEALIVKDVAERFLSGESLSMLTRELNASGIRSARKTKANPDGAAWTTASLKAVLRRARNAGLVEHVRLGKVYPAEWPAILDESQWRRINAVLDDPSRRKHDMGPAPRHLGTSLYLCGVCNDGTTVKSSGICKGGRKKGVSRAGEPTTPIYRCKSGSHLGRSSAAVDSYVREWIREGLRDGYALRVLMADAGQDTAALHDRAKAIRDEMDQLAALKVAGRLDLGQVVTMTDDLREQLAVIRDQLAAVSPTATALVGIADDPEPVKRFDAAPLSTQRAILKSMYVVTIDKGSPGWHNPDPDSIYPRFDERTVRVTRAVA